MKYALDVSPIDVAPAEAAIFLWCTPRSLSTSFERCFKDREEFSICHEPFAECYHYGPYRRSERYGSIANGEHYTPVEAVGRMETAKCECRFLLVKEMAFQAAPYVRVRDFMGWKHALLTRSPHSVARSVFALKSDFTEDELGFTALERIFEHCQSSPVIIDGDAFSRDPETTLKIFCEKVEVPHWAGYATWSDGQIKAWSGDEFEAHEKWHVAGDGCGVMDFVDVCGCAARSDIGDAGHVQLQGNNSSSRWA